MEYGLSRRSILGAGTGLAVNGSIAAAAVSPAQVQISRRDRRVQNAANLLTARTSAAPTPRIAFSTPTSLRFPSSSNA